MGKNKIMYCRECGTRTVHSYVCKETAGDGTGLGRVFLAVTSFGISETFGAFKYWQCQKCGYLYKEF